jgi:catechol 2,3-dioxygenase-like lactoylglutathione lyase family enzyme
MATKIRHTGLVVRDIDSSLKFYSGLLGLPIVSRHIEEGEYISNLVGIQNVKLEWAKLQDKNGIIVELLHYHSRPDNFSESAYPSDRHGASHVAFTINEIDKLYLTLLANNIHCNSVPLVSPDGKVKVLYCHDPEGILVELVEEL